MADPIQYRLKLDLQLFNQEKTEPATPKKRSEARGKGQVAASPEIPSSIILLFVFISFMMLGGYYKERLFRLFGDLFESGLNTELTSDNIMVLFSTWMQQLFLLVAPIFIIAVIVAVLANYAQFGWLFTTEPIAPKLSKINPLTGFKQMFSLTSLVELVKSLIKLLIIGVMVFLAIRGELDAILAMGHFSPEEILSFAASVTLELGIKIAVLLVVLAYFDFLYKKYEHEKSLKMSKQDIKDEHKKAEGDPLIKGKIKEKQRRMAIQRMMQDVPRADVVITNPTHYAVALQYDGTKMEAPVVLAKGTDYIALKIREIAKDNGVLTMENRPLARALYDRAEVGQTIPADLFQAVAEVLAYVYKLKGRVKSS
jgi:flagellar biosynthesis protein FlhB